MGINEYKRKRQRMQIDNSIQSFLDRFYMSRIGIRMLIGQHVALNSAPEQEDYVGIICTSTNVRDLAQEAIENARFVCEDYYGLFDAPKVQLVCKPDLHFMYVPGHLSHMLFETLKNSLRAVVETHGSESEEYPAVKLIVTEGKEVCWTCNAIPPMHPRVDLFSFMRLGYHHQNIRRGWWNSQKRYATGLDVYVYHCRIHPIPRSRLQQERL